MAHSVGDLWRLVTHGLSHCSGRLRPRPAPTVRHPVETCRYRLVSTALVNKIGLDHIRAPHRVDQLRAGFPDAMVIGFFALSAEMTNDPKDHHVLAAAVKARASSIITANVKDFPEESTEPHGVEAIHPDEFLLEQLDQDPAVVVLALRDQRAAAAGGSN